MILECEHCGFSRQMPGKYVERTGRMNSDGNGLVVVQLFEKALFQAG